MTHKMMNGISIGGMLVGLIALAVSFRYESEVYPQNLAEALIEGPPVIFGLGAMLVFIIGFGVGVFGLPATNANSPPSNETYRMLAIVSAGILTPTLILSGYLLNMWLAGTGLGIGCIVSLVYSLKSRTGIPNPEQT